MEQLERRILLAADLSSPQLPESARPSYEMSAEAFLNMLHPQDRDQLAPSLQDGAVTFWPTVVGGTATGTPPDSPANRVIPNGPAGGEYGGVGSIEILQNGGAFICSGIPLHERFVLTAGHCFDNAMPNDGLVDPGTTATFILNDGGDRTSEHTVTNIMIHPNYGGFSTSGGFDDLAIIELATPVPAGTQIHPLRRGPIESGQQIEFVGYGQSGSGSGFTVDPAFTVKRLGHNVADFITNNNGVPPDQVYFFDYDEPTGTDTGRLGGPTLGNDLEAGVGGGDSGGPTFVRDENGELRLVGTITFEWALPFIAPDRGFFGSLAGGIMLDPFIPWIQDQLPNEIDIAVTTTESTEPAPRGSGTGNLVYTIKAENLGPADASSVVIEDVLSLPAGVTVESIVPSAGTFLGTTWNLGDLLGWSSETLTVTLTVAETASTSDIISTTATLTNSVPADPNASNNSSIETTAITEPVDVQLSATQSIAPAVAGTPLSFNVTVRNNGLINATGVTVDDLIVLPPGASVQTVTPSTGNYVGTTWSVGSLAPGQQETIQFDVAISSSTLPGVDTISASFSAASTEFDADLANNFISEPTSVVREADLVVTGLDSIDPVPAGTVAGGLQHLFSLTNLGPSDVEGAVLNLDMILPPGVSRPFAIPVSGTFIDMAPDGTWTVNLKAGQSTSLAALLGVDANAANGTDLIQSELSLVSTGNTTLLNPSNDTANVATSIVGGVQTTDVAITIAESVDPVVAGDALTYVITATNLGQAPASGVSIAEGLTLPAGVTVSSITPSVGTFSPAGSPNGTWTIGGLAGGESQTLTVVLDVADATSGLIVNSASLATINEADSNLANNADVEDTSVVREVDIAITKTESVDVVTAGSGPGNLTHTVSVTNLGPSLATGVTVDDVMTIPAGVTIDSVQPSGTGSWDGSTWTIGELAPGAVATLIVTFTVSDTAIEGTDVISDTATLATVNEIDTNGTNNAASESSSIKVEILVPATMDFGDAPASYGTLLADDGARHEVGSGLFLGDSVDAELDGVPSATATGDDANATDDEDGIDFVGGFELGPGGVGIVLTRSSMEGKLDAWIDYNGDGDLTDPGEQILFSSPVSPVANSFTNLKIVNIPLTAASGNTLARFRLSSAGGLGPTGFAADGEVEDYIITIGEPPVGAPASPTDVLISGKQSPVWDVSGYSITSPASTADPLPWNGLNTFEVPYSGTPMLTGSELVLKGTRTSEGQPAPVINTTYQGFANGVATWSFDNLPTGLYEVAVSGLPAISFSVLPGDVVGDPLNAVGFTDFSAFLASFGSTSTEPQRGDLNGNGEIGFTDVAIFVGNLGNTLPDGGLSPASIRIVEEIYGDLSFLTDTDDEDEEEEVFV